MAFARTLGDSEIVDERGNYFRILAIVRFIVLFERISVAGDFRVVDQSDHIGDAVIANCVIAELLKFH
jgi:hypothetical protein